MNCFIHIKNYLLVEDELMTNSIGKVMIFALLMISIFFVTGCSSLLSNGSRETFTNPIRPTTSADPWVIYEDGYYYYCYSNGMDKIFVTKTERLQDIDKEIPINVWTSPVDTPYSKGLWAPELHFINDKWYIYFAADDGKNENHRMYAIESVSSDPQGQYVMKDKMAPETDKWAIDGTVLHAKDGKMYFIWSGWEGDVNVRQDIYISEMSNPYTLVGERVLISKPEYPWEKIGEPHVNEAPQVLIKNNTVHVVYSASGSWTDDYTLGLLTNTDGNYMNPGSWKKAENPVFSKIETAYGPGHPSFVKSPDGKEDWIVYHANEVSGSGWSGRSVRAQRFNWSGDYPKFGTPVKIGEEIIEPSGTPKR